MEHVSELWNLNVNVEAKFCENRRKRISLKRRMEENFVPE
jgi:hypothetical protein